MAHGLLPAQNANLGTHSNGLVISGSLMQCYCLDMSEFPMVHSLLLGPNENLARRSNDLVISGSLRKGLELGYAYLQHFVS